MSLKKLKKVTFVLLGFVIISGLLGGCFEANKSEYSSRTVDDQNSAPFNDNSNTQNLIKDKESNSDVKEVIIDEQDLLTPFLPNKPIRKYYSGGYENTGYIEISYGIIKNQSLSVIKDGAGIHAYIKKIDDDLIFSVYYDQILDNNISINILDSYVQNRDKDPLPINPQLNDTWTIGNRSFKVTAIDKMITVPAGSFNTVEVTRIDDLGYEGYFYYAYGVGLIYSTTLGYESELLEYDYDVDPNEILLE